MMLGEDTPGGSELQTALWTPSEEDILLASDAYVKYAAGIAILGNPEQTQNLHQRDPGQSEQQRAIILHAKSLMWSGLCDLIVHTNDPARRSPLKETEQHHALAWPNIRAALRWTLHNEADRLTMLNPMLLSLQPLPLRDEATYKSLAHGRKAKLKVRKLMDGFDVNPIFADTVGSEDFTNAARRATD